MWHSLVTFLKSIFHTKKLSVSFPIKSTGLMRLILTRLDVTDKGVFGHLVTDGFDCVTLERNDKLIPVGTYKVTRYHSPRLNRTVLLLHGVPGREMIEIHNANWEYQLEGCIAVGKRRAGDMIESSVITLENLLQALSKAVEIEIEIK